MNEFMRHIDRDTVELEGERKSVSVAYDLTANGWRDDFHAVLVVLARAMAAEKIGPHHLIRMTISTPKSVPILGNAVDAELLYREVLGGNFPSIGIEDTDEDVLSVSAEAAVPPPNPEALALNIAYSARTAVPEHPEILAGWRKRGADFRRLHGVEEIRYGDDPRQTIDLYLPKDRADAPVHMFIHGGYWQALDKRSHGPFIEPLLEAGIAVGIPNYRLAPPTPVDQIVFDCFHAAAALIRRAGAFGCNARGLTLSGHSAGGHLAAMLATGNWEEWGLPVELVQGVLSISGLFDLVPLTRTAINNALDLDELEAGRVSPIELVPQVAGRFICAVGGDESDAFKTQSREMVDVWGNHGVETRYVELEGRNHFSALEALGEVDSTLSQLAIDLAKGVWR